jgi:hypothetical protein
MRFAPLFYELHRAERYLDECGQAALHPLESQLGWQ